MARGLREGGGLKTKRHKRKRVRDSQSNSGASLKAQAHVEDKSDLDVSGTKIHHSCRYFDLNTPGNHITGKRLLQIVNSNSRCCHGSVVPARV